MAKTRHPARRRALVAATLSASFLVAPHAQSFERVVVGARHYFECLGLLLSDPKAHAEECLPNNVVTSPGSLSSGGSGGSFTFPVVTPPPPPPVDEEDDDCLCGACYAA